MKLKFAIKNKFVAHNIQLFTVNSADFSPKTMKFMWVKTNNQLIFIKINLILTKIIKILQKFF